MYIFPVDLFANKTKSRERNNQTTKHQKPKAKKNNLIALFEFRCLLHTIDRRSELAPLKSRPRKRWQTPLYECADSTRHLAQLFSPNWLLAFGQILIITPLSSLLSSHSLYASAMKQLYANKHFPAFQSIKSNIIIAIKESIELFQ